MSDGRNSSPVDRASEPDRLQVLQRQLGVLVLFLIALIMLFQLSVYFSDIIRILALSVLFSYLFINGVDLLERSVRSRAASILIVYLVLAVVTLLGIFGLLPAVLYQISQAVNTIYNELPQIVQSTIDAVRPLESRLHAAQIQVNAIDIITNLVASVPKPDPTQVVARMTDVAMSTMTWLFYLLSMLVLSFYFLLDGHRIKEGIIRAFPRKQYIPLIMLTSDMDMTLQAFFRGQIVLGLIFGGLMTCIYYALGIPYALALGVFLGVWEIVPVIGPTIGFVPTYILVGIDGMNAINMERGWQLLIIFLVTQVLQWLKDNAVAPRYIGNVIGLHPVLIFIAIMIGAKLDGMAGIICSLPAACVVNVLVSHLVARNAANKRAQTYTQMGAIDSNAAASSLSRELQPSEKF